MRRFTTRRESFRKGKLKIEGQLEEPLNVWLRKLDKLEGEKMWRLWVKRLEGDMVAKGTEQEKENGAKGIEDKSEETGKEAGNPDGPRKE